MYKNYKAEWLAEKLELADLFRVEDVDGQRQVSRWGFFADNCDGSYAIYKPSRMVIDAGEQRQEEEPGAIIETGVDEIVDFLASIKSDLTGISMRDVSSTTPCGWYFDLDTVIGRV